MEIQATARYIRQSPRKVRLVVNLIKGLSVESAEEQLVHLPKRASATVLKLLKSAVANAKHNNKIEASNLYVARAFVDQGPTIKRTTAKAFGRGAIIRKRMSHITIVVAEKVTAAKAEKPENSKSEIPNPKQIPNSNETKKKTVRAKKVKV